jgi:PhzF family phenazine biosynthesis protein
MTPTFRFHQLDVFSARPLCGNPLAVVHGADGLDDDTRAAFARWTNLSETTFLMEPTDADADYRVRIHTTSGELPFAGHPTLGSCRAWLAAGGVPQSADVIVQQCAIGLVRIRREGSRLSFAAPPLLRSGPLDEPMLRRVTQALGLSRDQILDHHWVDNGPGWCAVRLPTAAGVLEIRPDLALLRELRIGVIGPRPAGADTDYDVRAFYGALEDPVTGSLNAGLARWLLESGTASAPYTVRQGTVLGHDGRVHVSTSGDDIWIGGDTCICIDGQVQF